MKKTCNIKNSSDHATNIVFTIFGFTGIVLFKYGKQWASLRLGQNEKGNRKLQEFENYEI